jgi:hypothetical protein
MVNVWTYTCAYKYSHVYLCTFSCMRGCSNEHIRDRKYCIDISISSIWINVIYIICFLILYHPRSKNIQPESADKEKVKVKETETAQPKASRNTATKFIMKSRNISRDTKDLSMSLDPRARRLGKLLSSGVLDLQEEKISQLNIISSSAYDQYHRVLRSQTPLMKQSGEGSSAVVCMYMNVYMYISIYVCAYYSIRFCSKDNLVYVCVYVYRRIYVYMHIFTFICMM